MKAPKEFLKLVFQNSNVSDKFKSFIEYLINEVNSLQYADEPNYLTIHSKINEAFKGCGYANEENFSALTNTTANGKKQNGHVSVNSEKSKISECDNDLQELSCENVKVKRSRKLLNEVGSESPKVAINSRTDSPVIKRSKLVYESSASRPMSPKSLNRKEVMDVINGSDSSLESSKDSFENDERMRIKQHSTIPTLIVDDQIKNTLRSSPRLMKSKVASNDTPLRVGATNGSIKYSDGHDGENQTEYAEDISLRKIRTPAKKTPVKRLLQKIIIIFQIKVFIDGYFFQILIYNSQTVSLI